MILAILFGQKSGGQGLDSVYAAIVAAARRPVLYEKFEVADTLDGRFDMVILHAFVLMERLKTGGEAAQEFSQQLADKIFREMDLTFREMGVGDLSVGKRVRKLATIFYGRFAAYDGALRTGGNEFADALRRNVYPHGASPHALAHLTRYAMNLRAGLATQNTSDIVAGAVHFAEVAP